MRFVHQKYIKIKCKYRDLTQANKNKSYGDKIKLHHWYLGVYKKNSTIFYFKIQYLLQYECIKNETGSV